MVIHLATIQNSPPGRTGGPRTNAFEVPRPVNPAAMQRVNAVSSGPGRGIAPPATPIHDRIPPLWAGDNNDDNNDDSDSDMDDDSDNEEISVCRQEVV